MGICVRPGSETDPGRAARKLKLRTDGFRWRPASRHSVLETSPWTQRPASTTTAGPSVSSATIAARSGVRLKILAKSPGSAPYDRHRTCVAKGAVAAFHTHAQSVNFSIFETVCDGPLHGRTARSKASPSRPAVRFSTNWPGRGFRPRRRDRRDADGRALSAAAIGSAAAHRHRALAKPSPRVVLYLLTQNSTTGGPTSGPPLHSTSRSPIEVGNVLGWQNAEIAISSLPQAQPLDWQSRRRTVRTPAGPADPAGPASPVSPFSPLRP
jgi:hypothetical protein